MNTFDSTTSSTQSSFLGDLGVLAVIKLFARPQHSANRDFARLRQVEVFRDVA